VRAGLSFVQVKSATEGSEAVVLEESMYSFFDTVREANAFLARRSQYILKGLSNTLAGEDRNSSRDFTLALFQLQGLEKPVQESDMLLDSVNDIRDFYFGLLHSIDGLMSQSFDDPADEKDEVQRVLDAANKWARMSAEDKVAKPFWVSDEAAKSTDSTVSTGDGAEAAPEAAGQSQKQAQESAGSAQARKQTVDGQELVQHWAPFLDENSRPLSAQKTAMLKLVMFKAQAQMWQLASTGNKYGEGLDQIYYKLPDSLAKATTAAVDDHDGPGGSKNVTIPEGGEKEQEKEKASKDIDISFFLKEKEDAAANDDRRVELPLIGRITVVKTKYGICLGKVFGVALYVDGSEQVAMNTDWLSAGWLLPATASSTASFGIVKVPFKVDVPNWPQVLTFDLEMPKLVLRKVENFDATARLSRPFFETELEFIAAATTSATSEADKKRMPKGPNKKELFVKAMKSRVLPAMSRAGDKEAAECLKEDVPTEVAVSDMPKDVKALMKKYKHVFT